MTLLVAALLAGAWLAYFEYRARHLTLTFVNGTRDVPKLELTFYPDQLSFASPSPPPPLGERHLTDSSVVVDRSLVPGHGLVRYRGDGVGAGFVFVRLGEAIAPITLRPPQTLRGRVGEPLGFWCFGWRCAGYLPIAGAEVVVMGGGEHGVDLASTRTDAEGSFELTDFDGELDALGLRVRAAGYGIFHESLGVFREHEGERTLVALTATPQRRGRLVSSTDVDLTTLRVLARGLPGVEATPSADGSFVLDHVPADIQAKIVVHGLPDDCAQKQARTRQGEEVAIEIVPAAVVRGRVIDDTTWQPIVGALVWAGDQEAVRTDADGRFELLRVLPGSVDVMVQYESPTRRRAPIRRGRRRLELAPGGVYDKTEITLER